MDIQRQKRQFYNQFTGKYESATPENLHRYGVNLKQQRAQNIINLSGYSDTKEQRKVRNVQVTDADEEALEEVFDEDDEDHSITINNVNYSTVRYALSTMQGMYVRIQYGLDVRHHNDPSYRDDLTYVPANQFAKWWSNWGASYADGAAILFRGSGDPIWSANLGPMKITPLKTLHGGVCMCVCHSFFY